MNLDRLNVQELSMEEKVNTEGGIFGFFVIFCAFVICGLIGGAIRNL
jgi:hypothetical protein